MVSPRLQKRNLKESNYDLFGEVLMDLNQLHLTTLNNDFDLDNISDGKEKRMIITQGKLIVFTDGDNTVIFNEPEPLIEYGLIQITRTERWTYQMEDK